MIWLAHFVSASGRKKSFGKPCCDKSMRTAGIGSVGFFWDPEQETKMPPTVDAMTAMTVNFLSNSFIDGLPLGASRTSSDDIR
jgi:hypothetical protein